PHAGRAARRRHPATHGSPPGRPGGRPRARRAGARHRSARGEL
ncbi:MAG: hypothetical protein AVDCRST_MAG66-2133, partial [uncultured Pseudonocardia sp.]